MLVQNNNSNVNFSSLRKEKILGEKALKEFKKEFPYLESSTFITTKIEPHNKDPKYKYIPQILKVKTLNLLPEIYNPKFMQLINKPQGSFDTFTESLASVLKETKKANCDSQAILIFKKLQDMGLNPQNFAMFVYREDGRTQKHYSTVFNLKKGAQLNDPKTWGSKAMIVDAWQNIVMKAPDALNLFFEKLSGGKEILSAHFNHWTLLNDIKSTNNVQFFEAMDEPKLYLRF